MMRHLIQFSIVVAGRLHNPTILNPDFLEINEIVPRDWGWTVDKPLMTTPALAIVRYKNGTSITVEPTKLQAADIQNPISSKVEFITKKYVETLPHVHYTGIGINFQDVIEIDNPESYLKTNFLKNGEWDSQSNPLSAVGLRFVYPLEEGRIVFSLDAGEVDLVEGNEKRKFEGLIFNCNFHRDVKGPREAETALGHLSNVKRDWEKYNSLLSTSVGPRAL